MNPKVKIAKTKGIRACSLIRNTLGVKGRAKAPGWGLGRVTNINYSHGPIETKQQVG